jgi:hypothetical protein
MNVVLERIVEGSECVYFKVVTISALPWSGFSYTCYTVFILESYCGSSRGQNCFRSHFMTPDRYKNLSSKLLSYPQCLPSCLFSCSFAIRLFETNSSLAATPYRFCSMTVMGQYIYLQSVCNSFYTENLSFIEKHYMFRHISAIINKTQILCIKRVAYRL